MDPVITRLRQELSNAADPATARSFQRFFRGGVACHGVKTGTVVAIAKKYWKEIRDREKRKIFALCEDLYRSGTCEEAFVVSTWAALLAPRFEPGDIHTLSRFIDRYITNWASCDGFCNHAVGDLLEKYPEQIDQLKVWARSNNRWLRRAAAVSLIIPAKRGRYLRESLAIADLLLTDTDDMVQKGYGWLLKEASRQHGDEVFSYVMKNRRLMPRTALRFAIELMPKERRTEAMKKDRRTAPGQGRPAD